MSAAFRQGPDADDLAALRREVAGAIEVDADLRRYSRWRIGGVAKVVVHPTSRQEAAATLALLAERNVRVLVVGDGSNILFDDAGFDGVLVRIGESMSRLRFDDARVWAEAGIWVPRFVRLVGQQGLGGAEHAIGIPGTLGGLVAMNGGSRRLGIGLNLTAARGCDLDGRLFEREHDACAFRYRGSTLQDDGLIILEADFEFTRTDPRALRREMLAIMADRRTKFPKKLPNCGSVFLSDPAMYKIVGPPGAAIENVGLKGRVSGGAQISPLHANFIVNNGGATSRDVLTLIHLIRTTVHARTGFWMDCEVRHISQTGEVRPAHVAAAEAADLAAVSA